MSEAIDLYEADFALWAETQARILREAGQAGANVPVDWENVAEEIESLSRTDRRAIRSRLGTIIEHLLKLQLSPAVEPRAGWVDTIERSRQEAAGLLDESPSLRPEVLEMLETARPAALRNAERSLLDHGEPDAAHAVRAHGGRFTDGEVIGDWLPPAP